MKTNPIVRLNNPVPSDYRKYRQKAERPRINNHPGKQPGIRQKHELLKKHSHNRTVKETKTDRTTNNDLTQRTAKTNAEPWTEHRDKEEITPPHWSTLVQSRRE